MLRRSIEQAHAQACASAEAVATVTAQAASAEAASAQAADGELASGGAVTYGASALAQLRASHALIIEGSARHDTREASEVAATLCKRLRAHWQVSEASTAFERSPNSPSSPSDPRTLLAHWQAKPPRGEVILLTQGDPLEARGISAVTRAVAKELGLRRGLVALDEAIDPTHAPNADREGVVLELRYSQLVELLDIGEPSAQGTALGRLTRAVDAALRLKNEQREAEGKPP